MLWQIPDEEFAHKLSATTQVIKSERLNAALTAPQTPPLVSIKVTSLIFKDSNKAITWSASCHHKSVGNLAIHCNLPCPKKSIKISLYSSWYSDKIYSNTPADAVFPCKNNSGYSSPNIWQ